MKFAESNINEYLYTPGKFFEIPEFQRPYSWQSTNVKEYLSDLEDSIENNKNHYFGTIVQVKNTGSINSSAIIDGQQRVTTSLLMISAIFHLADPYDCSRYELLKTRVEQYLSDSIKST